MSGYGQQQDYSQQQQYSQQSSQSSQSFSEQEQSSQQGGFGGQQQQQPMQQGGFGGQQQPMQQGGFGGQQQQPMQQGGFSGQSSQQEYSQQGGQFDQQREQMYSQQGGQYAQGQQGQMYAAGAGVGAGAAAAQQKPQGFMQKMEDKLENTSKAKLALGALAGVAVIGGAVAGGIALKEHHDEKVQAQAQAKAQGVVGTAAALPVTGNTGDNKVRYGSKIALKHNMTGRFVHFTTSNPRATTGSNQTIVVAGGWDITDAEYWQVVPGSGGGSAGNVVTYGSIVRFRHVSTGVMLHSDNFKSIVSGQQEITGFTSTDDNDDWTLERWEGGSGDWTAETDSFRLVHVKTRVCLHSHNIAIPNFDADEVTGFSGDVNDENNRWRAFW